MIAAESTGIAAVEAAAVEAATVTAATVKAGGDNRTCHRRGGVRYLCRRWLGCSRWCRSDCERSSARGQHRCDVGKFHSHNRTLVRAGQSAFDEPAFCILQFQGYSRARPCNHRLHQSIRYR